MDTISGETVTYIYDALKRLTSASSTKPWTQTFQYDGFGNLTAKVLNGASTPIPVNPANNRLSNATYDADGNMTSGAGASMAYDEANRLTSAAETSGGIEYYGYSPDNKRVYHQLANGTAEWILYSPQGERMGIYTFNSSTGWSTVSTNVWFAGKLISDENGAVFQDRLGTNRASGARFYPYGDEVASTANDHEKFATYTRDSYTGLDYADQRYYSSTYGAFTSADPSHQTATSPANPKNPGTWNRYAYTAADPINRIDPGGEVCIPVDALDGSGDDSDFNIAGNCRGGGVPDGATTCDNPGFVSIGGDCVPYGGSTNILIQGPDGSNDQTRPTCAVGNGLTPDWTLAVETVLGENSYWLLGKASDLPGNILGSSTGPVITASLVKTEDVDMFSVLTNRSNAPHYPGTIGAVATQGAPLHPQFGGYSVGIGKFTQANDSAPTSSSCRDLTDVVDALEYVAANGSQLPSNYLFWKAISQPKGQMHIYRPGDIYEAGTAFSTTNSF